MRDNQTDCNSHHVELIFYTQDVSNDDISCVFYQFQK